MGFQIQIQSDLSEYEKVKAEAYADAFVKNTHKNNGFFDGRSKGGWTGYLRRGCFGYLFDRDANLVFRRISKKRRIIGIMKTTTLEVFGDRYENGTSKDDKDLQKDGEDVNLKQCECSKHLGSVRVRFKDKPSMRIYYTEGDIKG